MKLSKTKINNINTYTKKGLHNKQYTKVKNTDFKAITNDYSVLFLKDTPNDFIENSKIENSISIYFNWISNGYEKPFEDLNNIKIKDKDGSYTFDDKSINKIISILGKCNITLKMIWGTYKWYYYLQFENKHGEYGLLLPQIIY